MYISISWISALFTSLHKTFAAPRTFSPSLETPMWPFDSQSWCISWCRFLYFCFSKFSVDVWPLLLCRGRCSCRWRLFSGFSSSDNRLFVVFGQYVPWLQLSAPVLPLFFHEFYKLLALPNVCEMAVIDFASRADSSLLSALCVILLNKSNVFTSHILIQTQGNKNWNSYLSFHLLPNCLFSRGLLSCHWRDTGNLTVFLKLETKLSNSSLMKSIKSYLHLTFMDWTLLRTPPSVSNCPGPCRGDALVESTISDVSVSWHLHTVYLKRSTPSE